MTHTEYLIGNGWRPVPTIHEDGGWEHDQLSLVPRSFTDLEGISAPDFVRWPKGTAIAIQAVIERISDDYQVSRLQQLQDAVVWTAKFIARRGL